MTKFITGIWIGAMIVMIIFLVILPTVERLTQEEYKPINIKEIEAESKKEAAKERKEKEAIAREKEFKEFNATQGKSITYRPMDILQGGSYATYSGLQMSGGNTSIVINYRGKPYYFTVPEGKTKEIQIDKYVYKVVNVDKDMDTVILELTKKIPEEGDEV